jgi:transcriptional regulator of acetoin/glycerol metabolism
MVVTTLNMGRERRVTTETGDLRDPIAKSWQRAALAGLTPGNALDHLTYSEVDLASPLLSAACPVIDELNDQLEDSMFSTLLVDRVGRISQRWCGNDGIRRAFDNVGVDVGASLLEEAVGTNALGTVLETRTSISVNGNEHFAVPLRRFSCYGHPIFHPTTRRIEGVLDITALMEEASPLLPPLVARAVADIEQRLLDRSRVSDKQLLAAFQAAGTRRRAVVAIGQDLLMSNHAAADLLGSTDVALLRTLVGDLRDKADIDLTLESGLDVRVEAIRVGGARGGALLHVEPRRELRLAPHLPRPDAAHAPVLVSGPPGSGRSKEARQVSDSEPVTVLTAAAALLDGAEPWAKNFGALVRAGQGTVCVDGFDLLPDDLVDLVSTHVAARQAPRLVLVCGPLEGLTGRAAALASECTERRMLTPLASRLHEVPKLVRAMLVDLGADSSLHFTPGALRALSAQPWPGNLRELRAVVQHVVWRQRTGAVVVDALPEAYRAQEPSKKLAPIDRAERTAIIEALREHDGNKVKAAQALGISRTTLYAKMRTLRITVY